jgi:hypothetical protein
MEIIGSIVMLLGGLIGLIGWIWLIVIGFQKGGALWGILIILFSGLAGLIFCIVNKTGWMQLIMIIVGGIIASVGMIPIMMKAMENLPR